MLKLLKTSFSSRPLSTVLSRNVSKDGQTSEDQERVFRSTPRLIANLPEDLLEKLMSNTARKFQMEYTQKVLRFLETKHFPMPESLTEEQWAQLLDFDHNKSKTLYIEAIAENRDQDENLIAELQEMDKIPKLPLTADPEIFAKVVGDDEFLKTRWQRACYIHEHCQIHGNFVWPYVNEEQMRQLVEAKSDKQITTALLFFAKKQNKKLEEYTVKKGKVIKSAQGKVAKKTEVESTDHLYYGLGQNTIHMRIETNKFDLWGNYKHCREIMSEWHQPLVIDFQWIKKMQLSGMNTLLTELSYAISFNRLAQQPYALHLSSLDFPKFEDKLHKRDPNYKNSMENYTSKSPLEMFPKEKLVYLTPDSRNTLRYDEEDVYIIGGFVDRPIAPGATLAFAKEHNLRHARLPMKETIGFNATMNVETVVAVLLDYRRTKDWLYAFRWVQPRFFKNLMRGNVYTGRQEYIYFAHKELNPKHPLDDNCVLSPAEYRRKFTEILKSCPNPDALLQGSYEKKFDKHAKVNKTLDGLFDFQ